MFFTIRTITSENGSFHFENFQIKIPTQMTRNVTHDDFAHSRLVRSMNIFVLRRLRIANLNSSPISFLFGESARVDSSEKKNLSGI